jgi:hypothetical protein
LNNYTVLQDKHVEERGLALQESKLRCGAPNRVILTLEGRMKTLLAVTSLTSALPLCAAPAPDFAAARDEVVRYLSEYLRIDTVNPPGN